MQNGRHDLGDLRVLLVHDWIIPWGGAERVLTQILELVPQADLVVGVLNKKLRNHSKLTREATETWLSRIPLARTRHKWFVPLHYAAFAGLDTSGYDLVISSAFGFAKAVKAAAGRPHVCYCHSPPRYLWDLSRTYSATAPFTAAVALKASTPLLRELDRRSARAVTRFVSNSRFVAQRIRAAYGRDATVVYPPVTPKAVTHGARARESFLLVFGRLVAYKRIDLAIAAAEKLGIPLVVAGDGPERARLERLAGRWVTFTGDVDDETAGDLMERCRAFVFCAEEDFGIAPVEANAHGAPVVGYARGGLTETMVSGTTAVFFQRQTVDDVVQGIRCALERQWDEQHIRANAARFTVQRFQVEFAKVLDEAVNGERAAVTP